MALRIIGDILHVGRAINILCKQIAHHDKELSNQTRRAWVRAAMNTGEGQHRRGAKGANRFDDAMGEAREAYTGLTMALAFSYVDEELCTLTLDQVDRVVAILYKLANRPARVG